MFLEAGKKLPGKTDGGGRDRYRADADLGIGADLLCDAEGVLEQEAQPAPESLGLLSVAKRVLQLAENLRLAQDH